MKQEKLHFQKVEDQVIVITGASSGIGLATAQMAAKRGARLVLASRNFDELEKIANDMRASGSEVLAVETDVSRLEDVANLHRLENFERAFVTARTAFAGTDAPQVSPLIGFDVSFNLHAAQVVIVFVGAGRHVVSTLQR